MSPVERSGAQRQKRSVDERGEVEMDAPTVSSSDATDDALLHVFDAGGDPETAGGSALNELPGGYEAGTQENLDHNSDSHTYHRPPPFLGSLALPGGPRKRIGVPAEADPAEVAEDSPPEDESVEIIATSVAIQIEHDPRSFLRVTIMHEDSRGDLLLPGNIALAEILPSVVQKFTSLTPKKVTQGFILVGVDGTTLAPGSTLFEHGIADGNVLTLASRVKERDKKYDDIVEAVADAAEELNKPWTPQHTATTAVAFMGVLVLASLFILFQLRPAVGLAIPIVTGAMAVLHLGLAWVLQGIGRAVHAVTVALLGSVAAGVTGLAVSTAPLVELPAVFGGLAAVFVAAITLPLLKQWREVLLIPIIVGTMVATIAGLHIAFDVSLPTICVTMAGIVGIAILAVPQISVRVSGLGRTGERIDTKRTKQLYARGHRLWVSFWVSATLILLLVAVPTIQSGPYGVGVMVLNSILMGMGSRRSYSRVDVLLQYAGALTIFVVTAVSVVLVSPSWWPFVIVALLVVIIATAAFGLVLGRTWAWTKRIADIAELLAAVLLIPATVLAMELW